jgi:hypothetical protein
VEEGSRIEKGVIVKIYPYIVAIFLVIALAIPSAFAQGAPGAHGLSGAEFGAAASGLAKSSPGAVGEHASGVHGGGNLGKPGAHGLSGAEFGAAASGLAKSSPGAVGEHASGEKGKGPK